MGERVKGQPLELTARREEVKQLALNVARMLRIGNEKGVVTLSEYSVTQSLELDRGPAWEIPKADGVPAAFESYKGNRMPLYVNLFGAVLAYVRIAVRGEGSPVHISTYVDLLKVAEDPLIQELHDLLTETYGRLSKSESIHPERTNK